MRSTINFIKSKGTPRYSVWVKDKISGKWHCWGQVHSPDDYPNLLDDINSGKYYNKFYKGNCNYIEIQYLLNDGEHLPK